MMVKNISVDTSEAEARLATMIKQIEELRTTSTTEVMLDWNRVDVQRKRPVVEQIATNKVKTKLWRPRATLMAIVQQRLRRGLKRRLRRRIAPRRLRRLRRELMPTRGRIIRKARRVVGIPTVRRVKRRLGMRRRPRPEVLAERLTMRMTKMMTDKLAWR